MEIMKEREKANEDSQDGNILPDINGDKNKTLNTYSNIFNLKKNGFSPKSLDYKNKSFGRRATGVNK